MKWTGEKTKSWTHIKQMRLQNAFSSFFKRFCPRCCEIKLKIKYNSCIKFMKFSCIFRNKLLLVRFEVLMGMTYEMLHRKSGRNLLTFREHILPLSSGLTEHEDRSFST
jgi:hypothetical protein